MRRRGWSRLLCAAALFCVTDDAATAQARCEDPAAHCGGLIEPTCLTRLGAGSLAADAPASCADQLDAYRRCLADVAERCGTADRSNAPSPPQSTASPGAPAGHVMVAETPIEDGRFLFMLAPEPLGWTAAERISVAMGGRLAVLDTEAKQAAMASVLSRRPELFEQTVVFFSTWTSGPWIGGYQLAGAAEPAGGWVWNLDPSTGANKPVVGPHWYEGQPSNYGGAENYMNIFCIDRPTCATWNDAPADWPIKSYIVEAPD